MNLQADQIFNDYARHLQQLQSRHETLLNELNLDGVVIYSGQPKVAFRDDYTYPFRANPHFKAWLPLSQHPRCALLIRPGRKPKLYYYNPVDFWHKPAGEPSGPWVEHFEVEMTEHANAVPLAIRSHGHWAFIGEETELARAWGIEQINPPALIAPLEYARACKTDYELACLRQANVVAAAGHRAAKTCFDQGGSEFEIQQAYLRATGLREQQMPYGNIVGLNENGAILHYQHYDTEAPDAHLSLLIDAGADVHGYAADITRTYSAKAGLFADLIQGLDQAQQLLNKQLRPGVCFVDLHLQMHAQLAALLQEMGLVKMSVDTQLELGVTGHFFPHGLGHLLGLQVHDAAGHQQKPQGGELSPPQQHPYLRLTRTLEAGMVVTVEPGLYFIPSLLTKLASSTAASAIDWNQLETLKPFGGIRIEDNLCVTLGEPENFTRTALDQLPVIQPRNAT